MAIVDLDFEDPTLLSRVSGENGISFSIIKSSSADIITVSEKIEVLVNKYKEKYPNLTFVSTNDFPKYLKNRLSVMINNGIIGLILVNLVLWFSRFKKVHSGIFRHSSCCYGRFLFNAPFRYDH